MKNCFKTRAAIFVFGLMGIYAFMQTDIARADNCSGLSDCYGTILAVLLVLLVLALIFALPFILDALIMRAFFALATRAAMWSMGRGRILAAIGAFLGRTIFNFAGNFAGQTAAQINQGMAPGQRDLLKQWFGNSVAGAQAAARSGKIPEGLTTDTLMRYHEVARRAIESGADKLGVQMMRTQLIEKVLRERGVL